MNSTDIANQLIAATAKGQNVDFRVVREQIHDAFKFTSSSSERSALLHILNSVMDLTERSGVITPENMEAFQRTRAQDYCLLLTHEALIGESVSVELLNTVTLREIEAGRMNENHELRQIAAKGLSEPYLSIQELISIENERIRSEVKPKKWWQVFLKK